MKNLGFDITKLNGGNVTYENRKFVGGLKTIARLEQNGIITEVSYVKGENNNLSAYLALATRMSENGKNKTSDLANDIRHLLSYGLTQLEVANKLDKKKSYINQVVMLYQLNNRPQVIVGQQ